MLGQAKPDPVGHPGRGDVFVQVFPPSVVRRIGPRVEPARHAGTAKHTPRAGQEIPVVTSCAVAVSPLISGCQVAPASCVATIVPAAPTAEQTVTLRHEIARSEFGPVA